MSVKPALTRLAGLIAAVCISTVSFAAAGGQFPTPAAPPPPSQVTAPVETMAAAAPSAGPARNLRLSFNPDGTVTLAASNVTVREILSEWARQCGCYVVNWDKLPGGPLPVPVQYDRTSQKKVLESLLRQAAGYVLTPKRPGSTIVSNYETIYILATSAPVGGAVVPPVTAAPPMPMPTPGSPDDEIPSVGTPAGAPPVPQNLPARPGMPTAMPTTNPGIPNEGPRPSPTSPGVFVPIVPVGSTPATRPGLPPSAPSTPSGVPVPIVPAPQNR